MLDVIFRLGKDRYKSSTFNASQRTFNDFSTEFNSPTILLTSTKWNKIIALLNYQNHSYLAKVVKKAGKPLTGVPYPHPNLLQFHLDFQPQLMLIMQT